jgi:tRNA U34 5-carboxymethylaminomethyl modifying enzyme MnmG/GidA
MSMSLPADAQQAILRAIPGLEQVELAHPGYLVEYGMWRLMGGILQIRGI